MTGDDTMDVIDDMRAEDVTAPEFRSDLQIGQEVRYVPDAAHATRPDADGDFPWVIGRRSRDSKGVEELDGTALRDFLAGMRMRASALSRQAQLNPATDTNLLRNQIILVRPRKTWPATITAVNADGTAALMIPQGCVTHNLPKVKRDQTGSEPNTFHVGEPTKAKGEPA